MLKLLLPFLFCNLLSGASFNCTKASSNVEKMIIIQKNEIHEKLIAQKNKIRIN